MISIPPSQLLCREIAYGSDDYHATVELRYEVLRRALGIQFTPEQLAQEATDHHLACSMDGRLVGVLLMRPHSAELVQMRQFAVAEDCQRRGVGTVLVDFAERFAAAHGWRRITMHARESAVPFYERLGYQKLGERFIEVTIPHFIMEKDLFSPVKH